MVQAEAAKGRSPLPSPEGPVKVKKRRAVASGFPGGVLIAGLKHVLDVAVASIVLDWLDWLT